MKLGYLVNNPNKRLPFGELHRVMNINTGTVHVGYNCPACMAATPFAVSRHTGTFRAVSCKKCLAAHPEGAWPTPQRENTYNEDGYVDCRWIVLDFGYCFVAAGKTVDGFWRGMVTPAPEFEGIIRPVRIGGSKGKNYRQIFEAIARYIGNGYMWKVAS